MRLFITLCLLLPATLPAAEGGSAGCGGCGPVEAAPVVVETEHCHWLEVTGTAPGGPAEAGGVRPGDVIYSYDGRTVGCLKDLRAAMAGVTTNLVDVVVTRNGEAVPLELPAGSMGVYLKEWQNDVIPDSNAVVIPGVPALGWDTGKLASFLAALEAAQYARGDRADYNFLMGASGQAFRFQFFDDWCPSSPAPEVGAPTADRALAARGLAAERLDESTDGKNRPAILRAVRASIDSGIPVLACGLTGDYEWGVITGYQKGGEELFCRTYGSTRKGYDIAAQFPKQVAIPRRAGSADEIEAAYRGFGYVAGDLATERYDRYWSGLAAFRAWLDHLEHDDFTATDSAGFSNVIQANNWLYSRLAHDREAGISYLVALGENYLPSLAPRLDSLIGLYRAEVELLGSYADSVPCPGTCTRPGQWTATERAAQAGVVRAALKLEEQAAGVWQQLAQLGRD